MNLFVNLLPQKLTQPTPTFPKFGSGSRFVSIDPELLPAFQQVMKEDGAGAGRDNWFDRMARVQQLRDTFKAAQPRSHDDDEDLPKSRLSSMSRVLLKNNIIFINGSLTPALADVVMQKTMLLVSAMKQLEKRVPIRFVINSWGGSLEAMGGILAAMNMAKRTEVKNKGEESGKPIVVETFNMGYAGNSASLILSNGTPGYRTMGPFSTLTLSQPIGGMQGDGTNMRLEAERLTMQLKWIVKHLKETTKIPHDLLDTMFDPAREDESILARDHDYEAPKCLEWGIVDKIVTEFPSLLDLEEKDLDPDGASDSGASQHSGCQHGSGSKDSSNPFRESITGLISAQPLGNPNSASLPDIEPPMNFSDPTASLDDLFSGAGDESSTGISPSNPEEQHS